ncbi:MAG: DUF1501 domain-containing protein [Myxococcota bacterium]
MKKPSRRELLKGAGATSLGWSLRAAVTGLPLPFLLSGRVTAADPDARVTVLATSGAGESVNATGPGTFDAERKDYFDHTVAGDVDTSEVPNLVVNDVNLSAEDLATPVHLRFGDEPVRVARMWSALPESLRQHLVWFNHRTGAGIHPQFKSVLRCHGRLRGEIGRGDEQLPSAIAQETAALLHTATAEPFILAGGGYSSYGNPLASYSPTEVKTLVGSVGNTLGGVENFDALRDHYIDASYGHLRREGTPEQRRFLDEYVASRSQAAAFGTGLGTLLEEIVDDSIDSQLRVAAALAKLRIAPVIVTNYSFSGDNHYPGGLTDEAARSLTMMQSLDRFWRALQDFGILDDVLFATADVFGRTARINPGNGRGHYGNLASGLIIGTHLSGGVVGGYEFTDNNKAYASGINSTTGKSDAPDIPPSDTLAAYFKSVMRAAGVPEERREVRFPENPEVTSFV